MARSAVLLVAEDVLVRLRLCLRHWVSDNSEQSWKLFYLWQIVIEKLADAVAEEAVREHVGDLLQVLRLDRGHIANVFLPR